jgi:tRNA(Ile)-lysidine synthase
MLFNQVKGTIRRHHLLDQGDRVIVGVSGGVDSMVLLHLLNTYRKEFALSLIVAHVNHGLRPEESEREAELVRNECDRLGFPFEYGWFNVREFQKSGGLSLQDAGRRIRFRFFKSLLLKHQAAKVALGHHADDQVETLLLRWIRGAGLRGLKGMLPMREGWVIRPLLESWRHEIESFASDHGVPYLSDLSNLKPAYLRNRVRLELIPFIEKEFQPNFKTVMLRTSTLLREEDDFVEKEAEKAYQSIVREEEAHLFFEFSQFQTLHRAVQWRVLLKALDKVNREETSSEEGKEWNVPSLYRRLIASHPGFILELPGGIILERRYDRITLGKRSVKPVLPFEVELISPGQTFIKELGKTVAVVEMDAPPEKMEYGASPFVAYLDSRLLRFPLRMRNFRPGDRFQPLGVRGVQKLKEFFIDHKVPRFERAQIPLLISGEQIAWVVGYRIDDRVKITDRTQKALRVEVM